MIRGGGYEVDVFTNSVLASEKISSQHSIYSLVLTGWRMRGMDGIELGEQLSKIDPGIKIIVISHYYPGDPIYDHFAQNGLFQNGYIFWEGFKFEHLSMPVIPSELLEMINRKIKYGEFDESDILRRSMRRYRLRKLSPDWYFRRLWYQLCHHKRNN
jgi:DNA-binding NtrC family response regulator